MSQTKNLLPIGVRRPRRMVALAACAAASVPMLVAGTPAATGATKYAPGRKVCTPPKYPGSTGRSESLVTFYLSCSTGRSLALKHYRCRTKGGNRMGLCKTKYLSGYRCSEQRLINRGYYLGKVECKKGRHVAAYIYRQNGRYKAPKS